MHEPRVCTAFLADGSLFCSLTVVPETDATAFQTAFRWITESIRLTEGAEAEQRRWPGV